MTRPSNRSQTGFTLLALLLTTMSAMAVPDFPPFGIYDGGAFSPTVTVLESNSDRVRLHFEMEHLPAGPIDLRQKQAGTWGEMEQTGRSLPRITFFIAIPPTGNPTRVIEEWNSTTITVSPGTTLGDNGGDSVLVGDVSVLGGVRVVALTLRPIQYAANAGSCRALSSATISIEIDDAQGENPVPEAHRRAAYSRTWQKVYQSTILNWEYIENFNNGSGSHILLIVPNAYEPQLANFIRWKEERGIKCTVVLENSIGGNPNDSQIRGRIIQELENSLASGPTIDHVILVGDETQLQRNNLFTPDPICRFTEETYEGTYTNEGFFCMVEGTDLLPDVFLGRWVVNTTAEVQTIVNRTIQHERDPFLGDSARFERAFVAADFTEVSQRATKRHVARMMANNGFQFVDSLWGEGWQTPAEIFPAAVNEGRTFVNYRGSGWDTWWFGINFHAFMIDQDINNPRRLPIITGIGCGVGIFAGEDNTGFGETWMISGTPANPEGAVGFIGPCWNTHTIFNDVLDSSLYRAFLDWDVQNLSAALTSAKVQAWGVFNLFNADADVLEIAETMMRQYHVMSDPSLQIYTDTPLRLQVTHPATVPNVPSQIMVGVNNMSEVDAESLLVTVRVGAGNFSSRWIEPSETSILVPVDASAADYVILTVTGDNVHAFRDSLLVGPTGPFLVHQSATLNETVGNNDHEINPGETLNWTENAVNFGSETATGVGSHLTTTADGVTIQTADAAFPDIPVGQVRPSNTPYNISVTADDVTERNLSFTVNWTLANGEPHNTPVTLTVHAPRVTTAQVLFVDSGEDGDWERNETADLWVTIHNTGNGDLAPGSYTITSADPYIFPVQPTAQAPQINRGQSYSFPANSFRFAASQHTPAGHIADFVINATIDQVTYDYAIAIPFQLTLELMEARDPFADDQGLYWVYDNTDGEYQNIPAYQWAEIAPQAGGPGTALPFDDILDHQEITVPFSYDWFEQTFNTLSIAACGWVRPGVMDSSNYFNEQLPSGHVPAGMIAVLWDEIFRPNTETGQVCYYYDSATDKFIVEWHEVHFRLNNIQFTETFQCQLLNPATYPTESGNAQWVLLYQTVSNRATGPLGCTVGMESPDQQHGFTYYDDRNYHEGAAMLSQGRAVLISTTPPRLLDAPEDQRPQIPAAIELAQNYPNPFNPVTTISFGLPATSQATLQIFDMLGREVATLVDGLVNAGTHQVNWTAANFPSGIYIYRLTTASESLSRKMLLIK